MRNSEPFLPFTRNLLCKRIRFDDKLDLIEKIIPIDDKACLLVDRARNFHLKVYSPKDEDIASLQFPLPPYAHNSNPNTLYSVDYFDLYHYINKKKVTEDDVQDYMKNLNQERMKYIQLIPLGDYKLAVQLNRRSPVVILDLNQPENSPVMLQNIYGVKNLISMGNECLAWYERSTAMVILYHLTTQKRKVLNFTERSIKELFSLKDHVMVAVSRQQIEILDYVKNKIIKSLSLTNDSRIPEVVVHSDGNLISYVEGSEIHIWKIEKGRIKWKNYYQFKDYDKSAIYSLIAPNVIALKTSCDELHLLFFDSKKIALKIRIDNYISGCFYEPGLEYLCCDGAQKEGAIKSIHPLGNNSFGIIQVFCRSESVSHGQQRISVIKLQTLPFENDANQLPDLDSTDFKIAKSAIFQEFRDPVRVIDVFDDTFGMFITEKARVFRVNLKDYSVKEIVELLGLVKQSSLEITKIDKFFALAGDRVAISTRVNNWMHPRIVVFALNTRTFDFDSNDFLEETEEEAQYSFYDMIKLKPNKLLLSFRKLKNDEILHNLGNLHEDYSGEDEGYFFHEYNLQKKHQVRYDRLWELEGFVAMRHYENPFYLSFLSSNKKEPKFLDKEFQAQRYLSNTNHNLFLWSEDMPGILDIRLAEKCMACIQVKVNDTNERVIFVYNIETEELLNKIESSTNMIGTINHYFRREDDEFRKRERIMIFGDYEMTKNSVLFEPVKDLVGSYIDSIESDDDDVGLCITARNFKPLKETALVYENDHHKNYVCVLKSPGFKVEFLRVFQSVIGETYHKYVYKSVFDMIFGVNKK